MTILLVAISMFLGLIAYVFCSLQANLRGGEVRIRYTLTLYVLFLASIWGWHHWGYNSKENIQARQAVELQKRCNDSTMAYVMSQNFVKQRLKSPASADFPFISNQNVSSTPIGNCKFHVAAYVDAQNTFGAKIRTPYIAILEYKPSEKTWHLISLGM
ncbi:hypothetical protein D9M71_552830 [compost metagenome]